VNQYFAFLDYIADAGALMCVDAAPELMRAFEISKTEAKRVYAAWCAAQVGVRLKD
jgi:hypothetical protein